jgi:hypothetical protein
MPDSDCPESGIFACWQNVLRLNNAQINLPLCSTCTIVPSLRSGKMGCASTMQEKAFFLVIVFDLHHLWQGGVTKCRIAS